MLIHIRHAAASHTAGSQFGAPLAPPRLTYSFETGSLRRQFSLTSRRVICRPGQPPDLRIKQGEAFLFRLSPSAGSRFRLALPSGAGTSLSIIISPLDSLVRRRDSSLELNAPEQGMDLICSDIRLDGMRILYLSPDSLLAPELESELDALISTSDVTNLIIDGIHSVSEWSGDFRPAYLRLPRIMEYLQSRFSRMSVTGLTASDEPPVASDILSLCPLTDMEIPPPAHFFLHNVSHQAVCVNADGEKDEAWKRIWTSELPALMGREGIGLSSGDDAVPPLPEEAAAKAGAGVTTVLSDEERPHPHILAETGLNDTISAWICRCALAGADGRRLHCLRLADLPADECLADMAARHSRVPYCDGLVCAFGRAASCDYGRRHAAIRLHGADQRLPGDLISSIYLLDGLLTAYDGHRDGEEEKESAQNDPSEIRLSLSALPDPDIRLADAVMALHRMKTLGIITDFFAADMETAPRFIIRGFAGGIGEPGALAGLLDWLQANDLSFNQKYHSMSFDRLRAPNGELARDRSDTADMLAKELDAIPPEQKPVNLERHERIFDLLARFLPRLIRHIPDERSAMAYHRLWNLTEFLRSPRCRYADLLRRLAAVDPDWECEQCDRCRPDLKFARTREPAPPSDRQIQRDIDPLIAEWLESDDVAFDLKTAQSLIEQLSDHHTDLHIRAARLLETRPNNLKALYILRETGAETLRSLASVDLMRVSFRDLDATRGLRFFATLQKDKDARAGLLDVLDDEFGSLAEPKGEEWLWEQFRERNKDYDVPPDDRAALLGARVVLQRLSELDFAPMQDELAKKMERWTGQKEL